MTRPPPILTVLALIAVAGAAQPAAAQDSGGAESRGPAVDRGPALDPAPQASPIPRASDLPLPVQPPQAQQTPQVQQTPPMPAPQQTAADFALTVDAVNGAKLGDGPAAKGGVSPAALRAEVMLDRLHASPGVIDGKEGENFTHALEAFEMQHHLKAAKALDDKTWAALLHDSPGPVLTTTILSDEDVKGPFYPDLPKDYAQLAKLPDLGYRSPAQKIGAKYHMGEDLLAALNPGVDLGKAGSRIVVTDLAGTQKVDGKVSRITVDKAKSQVFGLDGHDRVIVSYPATIGSRELPSPSGTYKVRGVAYNPIYYYDPKNFLQGDNHEKLKLPPGPNNPVGSVFIALTKPTYGLHGTPDPSAIDKTASHGCVRMTNWDANELAHLVRPGVVVRFVN